MVDYYFKDRKMIIKPFIIKGVKFDETEINLEDMQEYRPKRVRLYADKPRITVEGGQKPITHW